MVDDSEDWYLGPYVERSRIHDGIYVYCLGYLFICRAVVSSSLFIVIRGFLVGSIGGILNDGIGI